jgi:hypothetical protein
MFRQVPREARRGIERQRHDDGGRRHHLRILRRRLGVPTGAGLSTRSNFNNNLIDDELVGNAGNYAATGSATNGWTMQMVAIKHN